MKKATENALVVAVVVAVIVAVIVTVVVVIFLVPSSWFGLPRYVSLVTSSSLCMFSLCQSAYLPSIFRLTLLDFRTLAIGALQAPEFPNWSRNTCFSKDCMSDIDAKQIP